MSDYCKEGDLFITEGIQTTPGDKSKFIQIACEEMDGKFGFIYVTPINIGLGTTLPDNQIKLLKVISSKLASGRMIMAAAMGGASESVNAYALYLIREAEMDLMKIANGEIDLNTARVDASGTPIGTVPDPAVADPYARIPTGWCPDSESAVTIFEKKFMNEGNEDLYWVPADNIDGTGRRADVR